MYHKIVEVFMVSFIPFVESTSVSQSDILPLKRRPFDLLLNASHSLFIAGSEATTKMHTSTKLHTENLTNCSSSTAAS